MSWIVGAGLTSFGSRTGSSTLSLMAEAATLALREACIDPTRIDAVITGYSVAHPHIMLANVFAEYAALRPSYCHTVQAGGATGLTMAILAHELVRSGGYENVLIVAGENRLTGLHRSGAVKALAHVGHPDYEVPLGLTVPAYYALLASAYMDAHGLKPRDNASIAVLMRNHARRHPGAHMKTAICEDDVLCSKPIATPLTLLDCCPISDGGAAVIVSSKPAVNCAIRLRGGGSANLHQHVSAIADFDNVGAALSVARAEKRCGVSRADIDFANIYDSFTITLTMLLEEIGLAGRGSAAALAREGYFDIDGPCPLNSHGGLLSYGHSGVAGGMASLVEAYLQLGGRAHDRQIANDPSLALIHADGGVMSSHVSLFLERAA